MVSVLSSTGRSLERTFGSKTSLVKLKQLTALASSKSCSTRLQHAKGAKSTDGNPDFRRPKLRSSSKPKLPFPNPSTSAWEFPKSMQILSTSAWEFPKSMQILSTSAWNSKIPCRSRQHPHGNSQNPCRSRQHPHGIPKSHADPVNIRMGIPKSHADPVNIRMEFPKSHADLVNIRMGIPKSMQIPSTSAW